MVRVCLRNDGTWFHDETLGYAKGWAFDGGRMLEGKTLLEHVAGAARTGRLDETLRRLNGAFALIMTDGTSACLISDKLKTRPLLYFRDDAGGDWTVCDNGEDVTRLMKGHTVDARMIPTFLALGHLTGDKTLYESCKIVPPGTRVSLDTEGETAIHYARKTERNYTGDAEELYAMSSNALRNAFARVAEVAGDRQIAIPLSGGYDSRLVACLCKNMGLDKVICFTYGYESNHETETSRRVAQTLGFRWFNVRYDDSKWKRLVDSGQLKAYLGYAGNLNAIGHIQDLMAIEELVHNGIIDKGCVVLPGHSGDTLGGSHLPPRCTQDSIVGQMYDKYYELNVLWHTPRAQARQMLRDALPEHLDDEEECLEALYEWVKTSRHGNFIINSVRAYEYAGLDWALPLWDDEYANVWESVPCQRLKGSALYETFMFEQWFEPMGVAFRKASPYVSGLRKYYTRLLNHDQRSIVKHLLEKTHIMRGREGDYDMNIVGELLRQHYGVPTDLLSDYVRLVRPGSMSMKALLYLSMVK